MLPSEILNQSPGTSTRVSSPSPRTASLNRAVWDVPSVISEIFTVLLVRKIPLLRSTCSEGEPVPVICPVSFPALPR